METFDHYVSLVLQTHSCFNVEARKGFYDVDVTLAVISYVNQLSCFAASLHCLLVRPDIADTFACYYKAKHNYNRTACDPLKANIHQCCATESFYLLLTHFLM